MKQVMYCCRRGIALGLCLLLLASFGAAFAETEKQAGWPLASSSLDDPQNMYVFYMQKCAEHSYRTFRQWPLEDQAAFAEALKLLRQRQLDRYGSLPPFAEQILANEHLLPTDEMIPQNQAVEIALTCARQRLGSAADGAEPCVSLYKTPLGLVFWHVEFRRDRETLLEVKVDAFSGGMLPVR